MYAALQSYSLASIPSVVILFFLVILFTLFLQQNLLYTFSFFSLFHCIMSLIQFNTIFNHARLMLGVGRCQAIYNSCSVIMYVLLVRHREHYVNS